MKNLKPRAVKRWMDWPETSQAVPGNRRARSSIMELQIPKHFPWHRSEVQPFVSRKWGNEEWRGDGGASHQPSREAGLELRGDVSWSPAFGSLSGLLWRRVVLPIALTEGMARWSPGATYLGTNVRLFHFYTNLMFSRHILSFSGLHLGPFMIFWENFPFPLCLPFLRSVGDRWSWPLPVQPRG